MKTIPVLPCLVTGWMILTSAATAALNQPPSGFTALFNGKDLAGWWGASTEDPRQWMALPTEEFQKKRAASIEDIKQHWRVENGELVNDGKGLYATTDKNFRDYELLIDYKTVPKADSGIYLKGCPQVQIWDYTEAGGKWKIGADKGSGGLWNNSPGAPGKDPLVLADKPFGEWNHVRVIQCGARTWVWWNNKLVVDGALMENYFARRKAKTPPPTATDPIAPIPPEGPIQLQTHGGEIRWRNIFIREIPGTEANRRLRDRDPNGFKPIFNGKNLDGWTGAVDACEVKDGVLAWLAKKGGTLYTNEEFSDFIVRMEFKLPPGANNGLAIRYSGKGGAAYDAMCECQVLDDNYEVNKSKLTGKPVKLDPRQAHGSAYGMVPAARGYQRPIGEWNYQEVTVVGPTIKVELNGTVILDADLSKVTEFMGNKPHPGKDRLSGHFGFAGHNDVVEFRNLSIKPLK
ncbi:MAG: DUF1080 domain-containing protein [Verrucomicrobia bacterium]|nr:DUF1080 domain-containing protein [Verrucomicrobiota bacterium]